jgi:Leucine-rich repeat (LRR) protein
MRSPTKAPSKAPTKAPIINCDLNTVAYINCITLSNRMLTMNGTTAEDKALQWLVNSDTLKLMPNSESNKTRLRQRFALLSFGYQPSSNGNLVFQSEKWVLLVENECAWVSTVQCTSGQVTYVAATNPIQGTLPPDLGWLTGMKAVSLTSNGIGGSIPSSIGAWTAIEFLNLSGNQLTGTIPSSIGAWKIINTMYLNGNQLTGTIPSTVAAWTGLQFAYFENNNLNGTMPAFGGNFCPKSGKGNFLTADCPTKVSCVCCNNCQ